MCVIFCAMVLFQGWSHTFEYWCKVDIIFKLSQLTCPLLKVIFIPFFHPSLVYFLFHWYCCVLSLELNLLWSKIFCFNCLLNQWICLLRVQHLKKFYFHFQDYVDLIIWKVPTVYPLLTLSLTLFPYFYFLKSFLTLHLEPI